jgi:DNA primase
MARIPQEEIDRIKHEVRIEDLVRARGIELRKHGTSDLAGKCPFHQDDTPSLVITPEKGLWHCMGACQTGGDVFAWVMKTEGVSFRHAYELLRSRFFVASSPDEPISAKSTVPKLGSPFTVEMDDDELRSVYVDYCHEELKRSPEAIAYLEKRGIANRELVSRFRLGFANRTLGLRLPAINRKEGQAIRSRLQNLGIYRASGHEHLVGCVIVPIFDEEGRVSEIYGRKVGGAKLHKDLAQHLYLPGPHRGVWNVEALRESKEVILCEAAIDALTFWCAGYRNVTWSYGIEGFTRDHLEVFKSYAIERVLIAYDRDEAGDRAAAKLAERLILEGISCSRIQFPHGMDANEYACKVTPAEKSLGVVIRAAEWIGNGQPKTERAEGSEREAGAEVVEQIDEASSDSAEEAVIAEVRPNTDGQKQPFVLLAAAPAVEEKPSRPASRREHSDDALPSRRPPLPPPAVVAADLPNDIPIELRGEDVLMTFGDRRYRIRGMKKNTSYDSLKINVMVERDDLSERVFLDTFDLAIAKQRTSFEKQAAAEIGVREEIVHHDMGQILKTLEILREREIEKALAPKVHPVVLTPEEHGAAMHLLQSPDLLQKVITAFDRCGLVGERTNKLVAYLAAISRKLEDPLAIIIQSSSAAGKTALMDAVLALMPKEERVRYSAMTGKALFYITETSLKHKVLAISEEEGAEEASYALKLLQSEGELTIASTGKDPQSGKLVTQEYHVEGPVMIILTTTAIEIDEELLNRCIVLTVDETQEQTRAIHQRQRELQTLEGLVTKRDADGIKRLHQNAQRLLRPMAVVNPFARDLTFLDGRTRTRRDHMKYLTLIRAIALLHQFQRPHKWIGEGRERIEYIEVMREDIAIANTLAHEVLGRSLDELAPQTRRLLLLIDEMVTAECRRLKMKRSDFRFSRKLVRDFTGWSDFQIKVHIWKLEELEYLLIHRGGRGQSFVYELLYDGKGKSGEHFMMGLMDAAQLRSYDEKKEHLKEELELPKEKLEGSRSPQVALKLVGRSSGETGKSASTDATSATSDTKTSLQALLRIERKATVVLARRRTEGNSKDSKPLPYRPDVLRRLAMYGRRKATS